MSADRERVRELVREELTRRLASREPEAGARHPALLLVHVREEETLSLSPEAPRPCVIEPDRPCYQSGYCKRLGY
jgi:hypothetical protein